MIVWKKVILKSRLVIVVEYTSKDVISKHFYLGMLLNLYWHEEFFSLVTLRMHKRGNFIVILCLQKMKFCLWTYKSKN